MKTVVLPIRSNSLVKDRPDFQFDMAKRIDEGFLAAYKLIELISSLVEEAKENGIEFDHVLNPENKDVIRADYKLSFSKMTFPHQVMRLILLEQVYRGYRIMKGEPYHK